jgi:hypothetical protein
MNLMFYYMNIYKTDDHKHQSLILLLFSYYNILLSKPINEAVSYQ